MRDCRRSSVAGFYQRQRPYRRGRRTDELKRRHDEQKLVSLLIGQRFQVKRLDDGYAMFDEQDAVARQLRKALARRQIFESDGRSEEHTSELQSLMRSTYADFCLKKK